MEKRFEAFGELYGFDKTIYRNYPLEKDKRQNTLFLIVTIGSEVVAGATIITKDVGDNYKLPVFGNFKLEEDKNPLNLYLPNMNLDYEKTNIAEIGGFFRDKEHKGSGINDGIYSRLYQIMNDQSVNIVFSETTKINRSGSAKGRVFNQDEWSGYRLPFLEEKIGFDELGKSLTIMLNNKFIKDNNMHDYLSLKVKSGFLNCIETSITLDKIIGAYSGKSNNL